MNQKNWFESNNTILDNIIMFCFLLTFATNGSNKQGWWKEI